MTPETINDYYRAIQRQAGSPDAKVLVEIADLRTLLDCWDWANNERPRIRRQARSEAQATGWIEARFTEVK